MGAQRVSHLPACAGVHKSSTGRGCPPAGLPNWQENSRLLCPPAGGGQKAERHLLATCRRPPITIPCAPAHEGLQLEHMYARLKHCLLWVRLVRLQVRPGCGGGAAAGTGPAAVAAAGHPCSGGSQSPNWTGAAARGRVGRPRAPACKTSRTSSSAAPTSMFAAVLSHRMPCVQDGRRRRSERAQLERRGVRWGRCAATWGGSASHTGLAICVGLAVITAVVIQGGRPL